jgi:hypothetical protein
LAEGGLVSATKQGRHRYFRLSAPDVAEALEALMGLAARAGHLRVRTGPKDPALRQARICYDHLAGEMGVAMLDSLLARNLARKDGEELAVTPQGASFFADWGVDMAALRKMRRPLCRACLDWSARRDHLAGAIGAAALDRMLALGWATRDGESRVIRFSATGKTAFAAMFPSQAA